MSVRRGMKEAERLFGAQRHERKIDVCLGDTLAVV